MQWKTYYDKVSNDVQRSSHPAEKVQVDTFPRVFVIPTGPRQIERLALENLSENCAQNVADAIGDGEPYQPSECRIRENAQVKQQYGDFRQRDR